MTHFIQRSKLAAAASAALLIAGSALAQPATTSVQPPALASLLACRDKTVSAERLACYDEAAAKLGAAAQSGDVVVVDREQVRKARREAFGFSLPSLDLFDREAPKTPEADQLEAVVASARTDGAGRLIITLEDGAVWAQTDNRVLGRQPRKGSRAEIRKGAMAGYFLSLDGQAAVRAKRVE